MVYPKVIEKRLMSELPFMATENIMMDAVKKAATARSCMKKSGTVHGSRQAGKRKEGKDNNLLELIAQEPMFMTTAEELAETMDPSKYIGCALAQVESFPEGCNRACA